MSTVTYGGSTSSNTWNNPGNWKGAAAPGATDLALFNNSGSHSFAGPISIGTVMLLGSENIDFSGVVNASDTGYCAGIMVCQNATMTFDAGSTLNDAGALLIGVNGVGSFIANGTAQQATTINSNNATIGKSAGIGVGTITIDGATWNNAGVAFVGYNGTGTLNVQDGGYANIGGNFAVASGDGSTGTVTVKAGSTLSVGGSAGIGTPRADTTHGGTATVTINAGGTLNVGHWLFENAASSLNLNGGTLNMGTSGMGWIDLEQGCTITGHGTLSSASNVLLDNGVVDAKGGVLDITSNVSGTGSIDIEANSTAKLDGAAVQTSLIDFVGSSGSLELTNAPRVTSQINGFAAGDKIILDTMVDGAKWQAQSGTLTLTSGSHTVDTLHLGGMAAGAVFDVQQSSGTSIISLHT